MLIIKTICISCILVLNLYSSNVRILTTEEPPTNYTSKDGSITGITTDIIKEIKKILEIKSKIEIKPWARSYRIAKNEPNIVIYTAAKTQERADMGFEFIGPITTRKYILFSTKSNNFNIKNLQDIKDKKLTIGTVNDDWRSNYFKKLNFKVQEVPQHVQNVKKLVRNRFDLWAISDIEAPFIAKQADINMNQMKIAYIFNEGSSYILLSKGTSKKVIDNWKNAYIKLQENGYLNKLSIKWSKILRKKLSYTNKKGFFIH